MHHHHLNHHDNDDIFNIQDLDRNRGPALLNHTLNHVITVLKTHHYNLVISIHSILLTNYTVYS